MTSQTQVNKGVCVDTDQCQGLPCALGSLAVQIVGPHSRTFFPLQSGHRFLGHTLGEATNIQEHGKNHLGNKSVSLQCGLHKASYRPCCLLSQHNESTRADSQWESSQARTLQPQTPLCARDRSPDKKKVQPQPSPSQRCT